MKSSRRFARTSRRSPTLAQTGRPCLHTDIRRPRKPRRFGCNDRRDAPTMPARSYPHRTVHTRSLIHYSRKRFLHRTRFLATGGTPNKPRDNGDMKTPLGTKAASKSGCPICHGNFTPARRKLEQNRKPRHSAGARFCRNVIWSRRAHAIASRNRRKAQGDRRVNCKYYDSRSQWKS